MDVAGLSRTLLLLCLACQSLNQDIVRDPLDDDFKVFQRLSSLAGMRRTVSDSEKAASSKFEPANSLISLLESRKPLFNRSSSTVLPSNVQALFSRQPWPSQPLSRRGRSLLSNTAPKESTRLKKDQGATSAILPEDGITPQISVKEEELNQTSTGMADVGNVTSDGNPENSDIENKVVRASYSQKSSHNNNSSKNSPRPLPSTTRPSKLRQNDAVASQISRSPPGNEKVDTLATPSPPTPPYTPMHQCGLNRSSCMGENGYLLCGIGESCSCDARCLVYGDCCDDFPSVCPEEHKEALGSYEKMLGRDVRCLPFAGAYVISSCPPNVDNSTLQARCSEELRLDVKDSYPVTDEESRFYFSNRFCALCNGAKPESIKAWVPYALFPSHDANPADDGIRSLFKTVESIAVEFLNVTWNQPGFTWRDCSPSAVRSCPSDDEELQRGCRSSRNYVKDPDTGIVYANRFCALCHGSRRCALPTKADLGRTNPGSFSALLRWQEGVQDTEEGTVEFRNSMHTENEATWWRSITCRAGGGGLLSGCKVFECPSYLELQNDVCVEVQKRLLLSVWVRYPPTVNDSRPTTQLPSDTDSDSTHEFIDLTKILFSETVIYLNEKLLDFRINHESIWSSEDPAWDAFYDLFFTTRSAPEDVRRALLQDVVGQGRTFYQEHFVKHRILGDSHVCAGVSRNLDDHGCFSESLVIRVGAEDVQGNTAQGMASSGAPARLMKVNILLTAVSLRLLL